MECIRSYSFGYSATSGSYSSAGSADRQEQANSEGFVKGHYSYLNNEGNKIRVEYIAGRFFSKFVHVCYENSFTGITYLSSK